MQLLRPVKPILEVQVSRLVLAGLEPPEPLLEVQVDKITFAPVLGQELRGVRKGFFCVACLFLVSEDHGFNQVGPSFHHRQAMALSQVKHRDQKSSSLAGLPQTAENQRLTDEQPGKGTLIAMLPGCQDPLGGVIQRSGQIPDLKRTLAEK